MSDTAAIDFEIGSDDEFGGDYDEPGSLRAEDVRGTVVYTLDWTVGTVIDQIDADEADPNSMGVLVTSPPFQRRTAWDSDRQSLFIESLMLGLPVPPIVLAESVAHPGQFYVLDGKQRLTALRTFARDETLRLSGLELLASEMAGLNVVQIKESETLRPFWRSMLSQPIRTIVVRNWQTPSLLHLIFSRLNKENVPLASHELRQAIFPGRYTNYINKTSAECEPLLRARRLKEPDFRLRDAETLLRYISLKTNLRHYKGDLRDFLDRCIKGGNQDFGPFEQDINEMVFQMSESIEFVFSIFQDRAFLRYDKNRMKYMPRFNIAVFELMTWYFADPAIRELSVPVGESIVDAYVELCSTNDLFAGYLTSTTKTPEAVNGRLEIWGTTLGELIGMELEAEQMVNPLLPIAPQSRK